MSCMLHSENCYGRNVNGANDNDVVMFTQTRINSVSLCSFGCCYGHRVLRSRCVENESEILEYAETCGLTRNLGLTMTTLSNEDADETAIEYEIAGMIETDPDAPLEFSSVNRDGIEKLVKYVVDKIEAIGIDVREQFVDLLDDIEDGWDDDEDDDEDDDALDDRWPGDTDEAEDE